jgi:hypothetical protein
MNLEIAHSWNGSPLPEDECARVEILMGANEWRVEIEAPFRDDPSPEAAPGSTGRLWEHEVVELMLLGAKGRYLELEFGPHGHYLVLELHGRRNVVNQGRAMEYAARRDGGVWRGRAAVPVEWLPPGCDRVNAYAIRGMGEARQYHAWRPTLGAKPDFHTLAAFGPIVTWTARLDRGA